MEIKCNLTTEDYLAFQKYALISRYKRSGLIVVFIVVVLFVTLLNYNQPFNILKIIFESLLFIFMWVMLMLVLYFLLRLISKITSETKSIMLGEQVYHFDESGLKKVSEKNVSETKWSGVLSIEENKKYILIFVGKTTAYIIPKRTFDNKEKMASFVESIKTLKQKNVC